MNDKKNNYTNEKKEIMKNIKKNRKNVKNKYIKWLYKNIKESYKYLKNKTFCQNIVELKNNRIITQDGGIFLTNKINSIIISKVKNQLKYECKLLNREIIIYIGVEDEKIDYIYYNFLIKRMLSILYILTKISKTSFRMCCSERLEIYIYLIDIRKELPKISREAIRPENVNSGYTYYCIKNNKIVVYRKEEWFKVFIHECLHALGLHYSNNEISNTLNDIFNINHNIKINIMECYVEVWARILNVTSVSYLISKTYKNFLENIHKMLNIERIFSFIQVSKILKHFDLTYSILVNQNTDVKHKYKESNTNVFSYYILTAICLSNVNDFFDWCNNNNIIQLYNLNKITGKHKSKHKKLRIKTLKNKNKTLLREKQSLVNFIKNKYDDKNLIKLFSQNYIHNIKKNNGLRMSIIEY